MSRKAGDAPARGVAPAYASGPAENSLLTTILIAGLFVVLIGVLVYRFNPLIRFIGPREDLETVVTMMEETESGFGAEGDYSLEELDSPHQKGVIQITSLDEHGSSLHSNIGYSTPIKPLEKEMSPSQVAAAWGEPLRVERILLDENRLERWTLENLTEQDIEHLKGGVIERWVYGDPLYGIYINGRYADFRSGRLIDFYLDKDLLRYYTRAMRARLARGT